MNSDKSRSSQWLSVSRLLQKIQEKEKGILDKGGESRNGEQ